MQAWFRRDTDAMMLPDGETLASNPRLAGTLPLELAALARLERLQAGGTGLCAPADPDFTAWLDSIPERWWRRARISRQRRT